MRSMFENDPVYIDVIGNCYQVDSISHAYERMYETNGWVEATIKAHMIDKKPSSFEIEKVIFNDPATIVFWADGTKTVVKCGDEDVYDYQTGLLMCIAKKAFGNKGKFNDILREWIPEEEEELTLYDIFTKATVVFNSPFEEPEVKDDGWFPCSERLPEEDGRYLTTIHPHNNNRAYCHIADFESGEWRVGGAEVISWMPLPEVYKGE